MHTRYIFYGSEERNKGINVNNSFKWSICTVRNASVFVHEWVHECMSNTDVTEDLYIKEKKRTSYKYLQLVEINAMIIALYYIII